jgi:hypothetical protein
MMRKCFAMLVVIEFLIFAIPFLCVGQKIDPQPSKEQTKTALPKVENTPPIPTNAPPSITYEQMLAVYKEVLYSSNKALDEVHKTAGTVLTIVGVIFAVLGIGGLGGGWWLSRSIGKAEKALKQVEQAVELTKATEQKAQVLDKLYQGLAQSLEKAQSELTIFSNELNRWMRLAEKDRADLKRSLEIIQIDEHEMMIFSNDPDKMWKSKMALLEMSEREDPIIRKCCVRVFGKLNDYDEKVVRQLEKIIEHDSVAAVKDEAKDALGRIKRSEKPTS